MKLCRFNDLPFGITIAILTKVNPKTLVNFRKTSKQVDSFVETHRFKIRCYIENPVIFKVNYENNSISKELLEVEGEKRILTKPFEQLSAFRIERITLYVKHRMYNKDEIQKRTEEVWRNEIKPLLIQLRMNYVDTLAVCQFHLRGELLSMVDCVKFINFDEPITLEEYNSWPNRDHIEIHSLHQFQEVPGNLTLLTRQLRKAMFSFPDPFVFRHISLQQIGTTAREFLMEIQKSRIARGKLEYFKLNHFSFAPESDIYKLAGVTEIWRGANLDLSDPYRIPDRNQIAIYQMEIDDGIAMIVNEQIALEVHIVPRADFRKTLFHIAFPLMFSKAPLDFSLGYENFVEAQTHQEAITHFYERYALIFTA